MSVYKDEKRNSWYVKFRYVDKKECDEFVDKVEEHSLWRQGNKPKYGEQMLMLSTCDM